MNSKLKKEYNLLNELSSAMLVCAKEPYEPAIRKVVDLFFEYIRMDKLVVIKLRNGETYSFSKDPIIPLFEKDMFKLFVVPNDIESIVLPTMFNPMSMPQHHTKQ